ncbi:flavodoxin family protein [Clostridium beijerinckii]|uniref:Flavodoxin n=1 Tax=Clostridium beijerinckii TaxID=1520 RepID=A0A1S8QMU5_CLOBE|nr:flavodoxin family protein [Clostridium beijerinckii]MZK53814.1 flavodoxin family protein [Clostridium beijerinckii]MZK60787.1 flavodoxin family protein [Clostridium beijerinckii]MZK72129.1 flavodoxin family protein [Clostridium beijerinckii]MZK77545.1 flavodoxin family protein [Clostridium beijerinckii]MZK87085.1 flavodoxin family protein [Clostridium beijerinckii]
MKIIAINGSPRKNKNTVTLLNRALEGAKSQGSEIELINLYDLKYRGCISCFACKRKDGEHGKCAMKDDLTHVLEKLKTADAIIFGSPIYNMNITSGISALLERFVFSNVIYSTEIPTVYPRKIQSGFIYTMGITEKYMDDTGYKLVLKPYQDSISMVLGNPIKLLYSYDTYQFTDYEKYESSMFSEKAKAKHRAEQFPIDCQKAFDMGVSLAINV